MGIKRGVLELNSRAMVNLEIRNTVGLSVFGSIEWVCESFVNWEGAKIRWTINFSTKKKKNSFDRHLCHLFLHFLVNITALLSASKFLYDVIK